MTDKAQAELNARFIQGAITLLGRADNGGWHRAIEVARRLVAWGVWDGESRIEFDAYELHDKLFGANAVSALDLVPGQDKLFFPNRPASPDLPPAWLKNRVNRRTFVLDGQTRYEIAWVAPDGEALASLYVTKGKRLAVGCALDGLKLTPDRARIGLVGGSVVADGEGDSARAAYRAADRDLRIFRQDPADLLRKLADAEWRAAHLQQANDELRAHLAQSEAEQTVLVRNYADLQRQAEQQAANSAAVIARLDKLLKSERRERAVAGAEAARFLIYSSAELAAGAARDVGDLIAAGWRVEQMTASADQVVVLMVNPRALYGRKPPTPARQAVTAPPVDQASYQGALRAPLGTYTGDDLSQIADREAVGAARSAFDAAAPNPAAAYALKRLQLGAGDAR